MSDDVTVPPAERVTMKLLSDELGKLRDHVDGANRDMGDELRSMLKDGIERIERAVSCIRDEFARKQSLDAAVLMSAKDRDRL